MEDNEMETKPKRQVWGRKIEYVLSLAGYTTGTSDFWRFPYLFWKNGGAAFLVAFLLALTVCAIPIYYLEVVTSQYSGRGMFNLWDICPLIKGIGFSMFLINLVSMVHAATIRIWVMEYVVYSVISDVPWASCDNEWNTDNCVNGFQATNQTSQFSYPPNISYSNTTNQSGALGHIKQASISSEEEFWLYKILALSSGIDDFGTIRWEMLVCSLVFRIILVLCVIKSIQSVGKAMYFTSIIPIVLLLTIWIQTLTLSGSTDGILYFFRPSFEVLSTPKIWMEAGFTAFFTLAVGYGGNLEIASHGKFHSNCLSSVLTLVSFDVFGSIFTSIVLFSVLGVMAAEMGTTIDQAVTGGTSVSFVGYTKAFSFLPAPKAWSIVFFIAVFIAMFDYMILANEMITSFLMQWIPLLRKRHMATVILVAIVTYTAFLPFCSQAGPYLYHLIDWYIATWSIVVITLIESIVFMWIYGGDRINTFIQSMNKTSIPHVIRVLAAYVCPLLFVLFLILSTIHYKPPTYGAYHYPPGAEALGWFFALLPSIPIIFCVVYQLCKRKGSLKERLVDISKPTLDFGPVNISYRVAHLLCCNTPRSTADLAYFNATGRARWRHKGINGIV